MVEWKDMCSSPPARAPKLQLDVEQPLTGGCWNPPKKDTPHPKTKKKLQEDGRRGTIRIKSNPISTAWVTHARKKKKNQRSSPTVVEVLNHTPVFPDCRSDKGTGNP